MNNKLRLIALVGAMGTFAAAQPALAATTSDTIDVSATVTNNCTVVANALAFPNVDTRSASETVGESTVEVTCTNGTGWQASADLGTGATVDARKMVSGANELSYALYQDAQHSTLWGDLLASNALSGTGTGTEVAVAFYGVIAGGQYSAPAGAYTDTVTVTVSY